MNKVILVGNLTRDPELTVKGDNTICKFTVACQRSFKNSEGKYDADFIFCAAFGKTAEFVNKYFSKGKKIALTGEIRTGSYKKDNGETVYTTTVNVNDVEFVLPKTAEASGNNDSSVDTGFVNVPDGDVDELPFN